jgi:hypothetical protein
MVWSSACALSTTQRFSVRGRLEGNRGNRWPRRSVRSRLRRHDQGYIWRCRRGRPRLLRVRLPCVHLRRGDRLCSRQGRTHGVDAIGPVRLVPRARLVPQHTRQDSPYSRRQHRISLHRLPQSRRISRWLPHRGQHCGHQRLPRQPSPLLHHAHDLHYPTPSTTNQNPTRVNTVWVRNTQDHPASHLAPLSTLP